MRALASGLCQGLLLALAARQGFWRRVFVAFLRLLRPGRVGLGHTGWTPSTDSENNLLTHPAAGFPRIRRIGALKCCMCCGRRQSTRMISAGWLCIQILTRGAVRTSQGHASVQVNNPLTLCDVERSGEGLPKWTAAAYPGHMNSNQPAARTPRSLEILSAKIALRRSN